MLVGCVRAPEAPHAPGDAATTAPRHAIAVGTGTLAIENEHFDLEVRLRGILVGHVQVGLGEAGWVDGHHAIIARTRGTTDGMAALIGDLSWELTSTIDLDSGTVLRSREEANASLPGERPEHHVTTRSFTPSENRHDIHAAMGVLRATVLGPGQQAAMDVEFEGHGIPVTIWWDGREHLRNAAAPSIRYRGKAWKLAFELWLSDDSARVPQRFRCTTPIGSLEIELVHYE